MTRFGKGAMLAAALTLGGAGSAIAQDPLSIAFATHSSASNSFWQAIKKGFDDGCDKISANCQIIFAQTEGSVEQQVANIEAALARSPDVLLTSIVDDRALDGVIDKALADGVVVIGVNVDDSEGAAGSNRQAFIGQGFTPAGRSLSLAMAKQFPEGPVRVLVGVSAPGQNWSEARKAGIVQGLEEWKAANPDRDISWEEIDSSTDLAIAADRVGAYLNANPETNVYFDTGFWHAAVAGVLADRGIAPGEVLLGGFDLVPQVVQQMMAGYIQVEVDQQPYMQGFMPVMQGYLAVNFDLAPADIDTGQGLIYPEQAASVMELSAKGLR